MYANLVFFFYYLLKEEALCDAALRLYYYHGQHHITQQPKESKSAYYPCNMDVAMELAALQMRIEYGIKNLPMAAKVSQELPRYLPMVHLPGVNIDAAEHDENFLSNTPMINPKTSSLRMQRSTRQILSPASRARKLTHDDRSAQRARSQPRARPRNLTGITMETLTDDGIKKSDSHYDMSTPIQDAKSQLDQILNKKFEAQENSATIAAAKMILQKAEAFRNKTKLQCMRLYLNKIMELPFYGITEFDVYLMYDVETADWNYEVSGLRDLYYNSNTIKTPKGYKLGISEKGILFISSKSRKLRKHHPLTEITKCDHDSKRGIFTYHWGNPSLPPNHKFAQRILVFKTALPRAMCYVVNTYQRRPKFQWKFRMF